MDIQDKIIITFTGASSSGKTYLSKLLEGKDFAVLVSDTTRLKRAHEVDGVDYNFLTNEQFQKNLDDDKMLQFNPVNQFMYGVSFQEVEKAFKNDQNALVVVAPAGVPQISSYCEKHNLKHLAVYIDNPKNTLMDRIIDRLEDDLIKKIKPDYKPSLFINSKKESVKEFFNILPYHLMATHKEDVVHVIKEFSQIVANEIREGYLKPQDISICEEITNTYSDRIHAMASKEFNTWVLPAYTGDDKYHIIATQFNQQTQNDVIDSIKQKIEEFSKSETPEFSTLILPHSNHYHSYLKNSNKSLSKHAYISENNKHPKP